MIQSGLEKTLDEIFTERANVLFETGEKVSKAIERLHVFIKKIEEKERLLENQVDDATSLRILDEINDDISRYNEAREEANLRYYYLIVTREAMGFRRHVWVKNTYEIPPRKRPVGNACGQVRQTA